jgi:hypothetical protein
LIPPTKEAVRQDLRGRLGVPEQLIANGFRGYTTEEIGRALSILIEHHTRFGGPLETGYGDESKPWLTHSADLSLEKRRSRKIRAESAQETRGGKRRSSLYRHCPGLVLRLERAGGMKELDSGILD